MLKKLTVLISGVFLLLGVVTLPHYGINWDTINHLPRGQAYFHYFLTGNKTYDDIKHLPGWEQNGKWIWQDPKTLGIKTNAPSGLTPVRSYYQLDATTAEYFLNNDGGGHPPLSDILSSIFNRILFGQLRIINDIDSYRVYGVFLAACTVGLLFYWVAKKYGVKSGLVTAAALASYPLFWAESHFNTEKDIPEVAYWTFFMYSFWKAINTKKLSWFITSGVFAGFALGTKFNILFSVFVIVPWFLFYIFLNKKPISFLKSYATSVKVWIGFLSIPLLMAAIFTISWPYMWPDPISRVASVVGFYKHLGTTNDVIPGFVGPFNINTYPFLWVLFTTPPIVILLSLFGIMHVARNFRRDTDKFELLALIWFCVPLIRVMWPHANTYGGVRQLMEYVPALAILAGLGFHYLEKVFTGVKARTILSLFVLSGFILLGVTLYRIHPNENVYFNGLIGGLSGAKARGLPSWGFSFGSPYRRAVAWLNDNAEENARVVYAFELIPNFPRTWLRSDFSLHNGERSGYLQTGEYAITLNYEKTDTRSYYDAFLVRFVKPRYQVQVDGVPVVTVWKNSPDYLDKSFIEKKIEPKKVELTKQGIVIDFGSVYNLSRIEIDYTNKNCPKLASGVTYISTDGSTWVRMPGVLPDDWRISKITEQPKDGHFIEPFAGEQARYVKFDLNPINTCLMNVTNVEGHAI